jgi:hypothetical protein
VTTSQIPPVDAGGGRPPDSVPSAPKLARVRCFRAGLLARDTWSGNIFCDFPGHLWDAGFGTVFCQGKGFVSRYSMTDKSIKAAREPTVRRPVQPGPPCPQRRPQPGNLRAQPAMKRTSRHFAVALRFRGTGSSRRLKCRASGMRNQDKGRPDLGILRASELLGRESLACTPPRVIRSGSGVALPPGLLHARP